MGHMEFEITYRDLGCLLLRIKNINNIKKNCFKLKFQSAYNSTILKIEYFETERYFYLNFLNYVEKAEELEGILG